MGHLIKFGGVATEKETITFKYSFMKKFLTAIMAFALVATVSVYAEATTSVNASSSTTLSSSSKTKTSKGYTTGKTGGKALKAIYDNYKKEGKLNLKSASNIVNITLIGTSFKGYKDQDSDYKSDFNTGLLEGLGLKSDSSSSSITDALSGLSSSMSSFSSSSSSSDESSISSVLTDIFDKLK